MTFLHCFVVVLCTIIGQACDVIYDFGENTDVHATKVKATATWWTVDPPNIANVYLATALGTGCNSGYFGAQFHSDANYSQSWQSVLFSFWDSPMHTGKTNNSEWPFQAMPASGNCRRNSLDATGPSTGVQCGQPWPAQDWDGKFPYNSNASVNISLHFGVGYEFTMEMTMQNKSGALWELTMFDPVHGMNISVGKIFFVDAPLGLPSACRGLGKSQNPPTQGLSSYAFLEYFDDPPFPEKYHYTTRSTLSGLTVFSPNNTAYPVKDIVKDCCGHTYPSYDTNKSYYDTSSRCFPPECSSFELTFLTGPYVTPSKSALAANPECQKSNNRDRVGSKLKSCWQQGPPPSLDYCFGPPSIAEQYIEQYMV